METGRIVQLTTKPAPFASVGPLRAAQKRRAGDIARQTGLAAYLCADDGRPDLFEADNTGHYSFPCCACTHRYHQGDACSGCRHYAR